MRKLKTIEISRLTTEEFKQTQKIPLVVVLDNIRSFHNIGAVFRTADAFCLEGIYLCGITATPPSADIHKTALGAEQSVSWHYEADTLKAIAQLKAQGYTIYAVEQAEGSTTLEDIPIRLGQKYAIVLGHEVFGVQQEVIDNADACIEIPQYGTKHSLNVSVTAGIVMYHFSTHLREN